jgi:P27 family predicted phage terminase small subunit
MPRGRPPVPSVLKRARGNPGKRTIHPEPEPPKLDEAPPAPAWLLPEAAEEWRRVVPELHALGLLTRVDPAALEAYCTCYGRWRRAEDHLQQHGDVIVIRDERGEVRQTYADPYVGIAQKNLERMQRYAAEFGLSPAARTRIKVKEAPTDADPFAGHDGGPAPLRVVEGGKGKGARRRA